MMKKSIILATLMFSTMFTRAMTIDCEPGPQLDPHPKPGDPPPMAEYDPGDDGTIIAAAVAALPGDYSTGTEIASAYGLSAGTAEVSGWDNSTGLSLSTGGSPVAPPNGSSSWISWYDAQNF